MRVTMKDINGLTQEYGNIIGLALELPQACTEVPRYSPNSGANGMR